MNAWSNPDFGWQIRATRSRAGSWAGARSRSSAASPSSAASAPTPRSSATTRTSPGRSGCPAAGPDQLRPARRSEPGPVADDVRRLNRRLPPDVQALSRAELDADRGGLLGPPDGHGQDLRLRRPRDDAGGRGGHLPGALQRHPRATCTEYATLKAMGHTNGYLSRVVLVAGAIYALAAYVPAVAVRRRRSTASTEPWPTSRCG